jgi:Conjugal transfer protein TraD
MAIAVAVRRRKWSLRLLAETWRRGRERKAGLVELVDDDGATLLGAFLELANRLHDGDDQVSPTDLRTRWRRRGLRAFEADRESNAQGPDAGGDSGVRNPTAAGAEAPPGPFSATTD